MNTVTDNDKITGNIEGYEKREFPVDRFDLEEQIQNVWQTKEDLEAVTERIMESTVFMTPDQISNVLTGISELHETRMWKLWQVLKQWFAKRIVLCLKNILWVMY